MLIQTIIDTLNRLKLYGLDAALAEQRSQSAAASLAFEERLGLLLDREVLYRDNQRLKRLLTLAQLKHRNACVEDIDYRHNRGLDKSMMASLLTCQWIERGLNMILTGPTGCGKTWLACAFGNQACRIGKTVLFHRLPLLLEDLQIGHADGSFHRRLALLAKADLLVLDDFGLAALNAQGRTDLLEVVDARSGGRSTIITSQLPVDKWHDYLGSANPTVADAILDRLTSGAVRLPMRGESMRKVRARETGTA